MKSIKLNKSLLKKHPADILVELGAVDKEKKQGYPGHLYFSAQDYKELRNNVTKLAKKERPYAPSKSIQATVGWVLLDYGPNESLGDAIKPGYALIDEEAIKNSKDAT